MRGIHRSHYWPFVRGIHRSHYWPFVRGIHRSHYWPFVRGIHRSHYCPFVRGIHRSHYWPGNPPVTLLALCEGNPPVTLLALCEGNPPVTSGFPSQRDSNMNISCFMVSLNQLLNRQQSCQWFEIPWPSCSVIVMASNSLKLNMISLHCTTFNWPNNRFTLGIKPHKHSRLALVQCQIDFTIILT